MKKLISTLFISMFIGVSHAQEESIESMPKNVVQCIDQLGNNSSDVLNRCESTYLDYYFQKYRGTFSFRDKTVFFLRGNAGGIKSDKKTYFEEIKETLTAGFLPSYMVHQLLIFDEGERKKMGYDATITLGSKKYITKKNAIKRIKKHIKKRY